MVLHMCFSATGSFAVAGFLGGVGTATLARNASVPHRMLAAIPLLFAAQQATEGVVWLTMADGDGAQPHRLAVTGFLAFAFVVWPTWLPLALWSAESDPKRRQLLLGLCAVGMAASTYAALAFASWQPIARIAGHSIHYQYAAGQTGPGPVFTLVAYTLATVVPFFVSSITLARTIGIVFVASLVATFLIERAALASVWCFFAAILSLLVFFALEREQPQRSATA
jgi:hypothetical protein